MHPYINRWEGKHILIVFSDPGGAKAMLALASILSVQSKVSVYSDREYAFFSDFEIPVHKCAIGEESNLLKGTDVLITATSHPSKTELHFIKEAHIQSIYSVSFIDHWRNYRLRFEYGDVMMLPNEVWVIDQKARDESIIQGIPQDILVISSNPYYSWIQQWKPSIDRISFWNSLGKKANDRFILFAPDPISMANGREVFGFDERDGLDVVLEAFQNVMPKNTYLVCKWHPNQDMGLIRPIIDRYSSIFNFIFSPSNVDLNTLMYHSDIVLGFWSNLLIEADILGRPVYRVLVGLHTLSMDPLNQTGIGSSIYDKVALSSFFNTIK